MSFLSRIGGTTLSPVQDPFNKKCVTDIHVSWGVGFFTDTWRASGYVKFKNGNTEGKQQFDGTDFDDVVQKIKAFCNSL